MFSLNRWSLVELVERGSERRILLSRAEAKVRNQSTVVVVVVAVVVEAVVEAVVRLEVGFNELCLHLCFN